MTRRLGRGVRAVIRSYITKNVKSPH